MSHNQQIMHSSVGAPPQGNGGMIIGGQAPNQQTAIYKTNTLDQYGGRNSALNNINALQSVMGGTGVGGANHHRNHATNQSANMIVRGMTGVNLMNYSIL
jgi:hypothetical protein